MKKTTKIASFLGFISLLGLFFPLFAGATNTHSASFSGGTDTQYLYNSGYPAYDGDLTIEMWVKLNSTANRQNFINVWDINTHYSFKFWYESSALRWANSTNRTTPPINKTVAWSPSTGTWYHLAVVYTASAGSVAFYVNGTQQGSTQTGLPTTLKWDVSQKLKIGSLNGDYDVNGYIDDVRVYSLARTSTQIASDYGLEIDSASNLQGSYHLNNSLSDSSGNSRTLTNTGSVSFSATYHNAVNPTVSAMSPNTGDNNDDISLTSITGTNFATGLTVYLAGDYAGRDCTGFTVASATSITGGTCPISELPTGNYHLIITNPDGGLVEKADYFTITHTAPDSTITLEYPVNNDLSVDSFTDFYGNFDYNGDSGVGLWKVKVNFNKVGTATTTYETLKWGSQGEYFVPFTGTLESNQTYFAQAILYETDESYNYTPVATSTGIMFKAVVSPATEPTDTYYLAVSTTTPTTQPTATTTGLVITCDPNSSYFSYSFCKLFRYLFEPSQDSFTKWSTLKSELSTKPPFGYFTVYQDVISDLTTSTTTKAVQTADLSALDDSFFSDLKVVFTLLIWFLFAWSLFNRLKTLEL